MPPQVINYMQSTPTVPSLSSRLTSLPINFELSPIIRQENIEHISNVNDIDIQTNNFNPLTRNCISEQNYDVIDPREASSIKFNNILEPTKIELSTWIGGMLIFYYFQKYIFKTSI